VRSGEIDTSCLRIRRSDERM